jgi:hypothetical protein
MCEFVRPDRLPRRPQRVRATRPVRLVLGQAVWPAARSHKCCTPDIAASHSCCILMPGLTGAAAGTGGAAGTGAGREGAGN